MSSSGAALDKKGSHQQQQKQQQKLPPRPPSSLTAAAAAAAALEKKEKQQEAPFKKSNQPNAATAEGAKTNPPLSSGTTGTATGATGAAAKSPSPRPSSDSKTDSKKAASAASTLAIVKDPPTDEQKGKKDSHSNGNDLSKQEPRSNNGSNNLAEAAAAGATTNSKEEGRKRQQQEQQQIATIRRRRSKRVLVQDPIIAPGYGTRKDILRLTHELNWGNNDENNDNTNTTTLPYEVVEEIMKARGRGIRSSSRQREQQESAAAAAAATATPVSSAWADFMKEEGVLSGGGGGGGNKKDDGDKKSDSSPNRSSKRKANPNDDEDNDQDNDNNDAKMAASGDTATGGDSDARHYVLPVEWEEMEAASSSKKKKPRATTSAQDSTAGGVLLQAGTLDANIVGRSKSSGSKSQKQQQQQAAAAAFHCPIPTRILFPSNPIQILHVFTSCNAVHSFALATNGITYGWGRNECNQLGPLLNVAGGDEQDNNKDDDDNNNDHEKDEEDDDDDNKKSSKKKSSKKKKTSTKEKDAGAAAASAGFPKNVYTPTEIDLPAPLRMAAVGKSHSLFLLQDNSLFAVGANKSGQCSVKNYQEIVPTLRKCVLPDNVVLAQIACGEDFSMAISTAGHLYSCGSSQYGQLGTGETGEYFVTANKLAFTNVNVFERRTTFCHAPNEKLHTNSEVAKVVPIPNGRDILFQQVACGKHHTLLVEANTSSSSERPRVFSFGCGDYGCLGHGVQKDEYLPRMIGLFAKLPLGQVSEDSSFKVSAGAHCSLLQTPSGHVYYWGKHRSVGEAAMRPQLVDALANNQHVVTHCTAGGQTVVCSTSLGQTVAWGQGPHGELGLGKAKSSAKPTFVDSLNGIQVLDMAAGYGHTLFVVEKGAAGVAKLPQVDEDDLELLAGVAN